MITTKGTYKSVSNGLPLKNVTMPIENNIGGGGLTLPQVASASLLLDLEADTLSLSDSDPVSLWADQSGNGHDFTASGDQRPTKQTDGDNFPYVVGDANLQFMGSGNFADNLPSIGVIYVWAIEDFGLQGTANEVVSKYSLDTFNPPLWAFGTTSIDYQQDSENSTAGTIITSDWLVNAKRYVQSSVVKNYTTPQMLINGSEEHSSYGGGGVVTSVANSDNVNLLVFSYARLYSVLIYQITDLINWSTDCAAITAWLASRYGITL